MPSHVLLDTKLDGLSLVRRGKVRDVYAAGDDLILVATDRISAFDYVLGSGIPDKGRVLNQLSAFWFGRTGGIIKNHLISTDVAAYPESARRVCRRARGPIDADAAHDTAARRVRRARLHLGIGMEGLQGDRRSLRHSAAERPEGIGSPAGADLHARDEGRVRSRREHQRGRGGTGRRRRAPRALEDAHARTLRARRGTRRIEGHHPRRYEVRIWIDRLRRAAV